MAQIPDIKSEAGSSTKQATSTDDQKLTIPAPPATNPFILASKQKLPQSKSHKITLRIANHLIQNMHPFSEVDSVAFREMIHECEPRYKVPSTMI